VVFEKSEENEQLMEKLRVQEEDHESIAGSRGFSRKRIRDL